MARAISGRQRTLTLYPSQGLFRLGGSPTPSRLVRGVLTNGIASILEPGKAPLFSNRMPRRSCHSPLYFGTHNPLGGMLTDTSTVEDGVTNHSDEEESLPFRLRYWGQSGLDFQTTALANHQFIQQDPET